MLWTPQSLFIALLLTPGVFISADEAVSKTDVLFETSSSLSISDVRAQIIEAVQSGELDPENKHQVRAPIAPGQYKESLKLDHPALSHTSWEGVVDGTTLPTISGGIEVPFEFFSPWDSSSSILKASLKNLGAMDLGKMTSGNAVADCQHDKVGLTINGGSMTLAR